jgi:hypothetical protein
MTQTQNNTYLVTYQLNSAVTGQPDDLGAEVTTVVHAASDSAFAALLAGDLGVTVANVIINGFEQLSTDGNVHQ